MHDRCLEDVGVPGLSQNRHPDLPRRPLSTYMLFYMEKKDKVARENPGLEMVSSNSDHNAYTSLAISFVSFCRHMDPRGRSFPCIFSLIKYIQI
jgi:hypothetical protein